LRTTSSLQSTSVLLLLLTIVTIGLYWSGLDGDFMFDDIAHVKKNSQLAITGLSFDELYQAWNSSPLGFPGNRPLSMLTFGINHAISGLDPFWFKATNLLIHILCGLGIFILTRKAAELFSRAQNLSHSRDQVNRWALLTTALWILSPINLSPILYIVQRMAGLSAFFVILALIFYVQGRRKMMDGTGGYVLIFVAAPILGLMAFLCKENGALLPGLILIMEFTLFQFKSASCKGQRVLKLALLIAVVIPAVSAIAYLLWNPEWILNGYNRRQFTLGERLLTETRVLWFYLQMLVIPDNSQLGFYHDDFMVSKSILNPASTLFSIIGLAGILIFSALKYKKHPVPTFGILFFLYGHILESSFVALELVYEHRNYLPSIGPFFALAFYLTKAYEPRWRAYLASGIAVFFIIMSSISTGNRASDWSNEFHMTMTEVVNHPNSPRANFRAGQFSLTAMSRSKEPEKDYRSARYYLERAVELNPRNADGLFGLIVLSLHANKPVEQRWLRELKYRLEHIPYDPQNVTTSQFSYLVKWHLALGTPKLHSDQILGIFEAVLRNPVLDRYAKAGIHSALSAYYHLALKKPIPALRHARIAAKSWPQRWSHQKHLIQLFVALDRFNDAEAQLKIARKMDTNGVNIENLMKAEQFIASARNQRKK